MEAAPQPHTPVHQRYFEDRDQTDHCAAFGALLVRTAKAADGEVADVGDEQQGGAGGVPGEQQVEGDGGRAGGGGGEDEVRVQDPDQTEVELGLCV